MSKTTCPNCGDDYVRISRHWSSCGYPSIPSDIRRTIEGIVLSGATVAKGGGNCYARVITANADLAAWLATRLDWMCNSHTEFEDAGTTRYRIRTPAHPHLNHFEGWTDGGPPEEFALHHRAGRVWWALAGGLQWSGPYDSQRQATFSAKEDDKAAWIQRVLDDAGFESVRAGKRVQLSPTTTAEWLDWIDDPVPGVAYKWADSRIDYQAQREAHESQTDTKTARYRAALEVARERTDGELTPERFEARVDAVEAAEVADWLGGGDWGDALSVTNIDQSPTIEGQRGMGGFSDEELISAVAEFGSQQSGGKLSSVEYRKWAHKHPDRPSYYTLLKRVGTWSKVCERAGYEPVREDHTQSRWSGDLTREDAVAYLREFVAAVEEPHTTRKYNAYRRAQQQELPSHQVLLEWPWNDLVQDAGGTPGARKDAVEVSYDRFLDELVAIRERTGEWPKSTTYPDERADGSPSRKEVYRLDTFPGWKPAIEDAKQRHEDDE